MGSFYIFILILGIKVISQASSNGYKVISTGAGWCLLHTYEDGSIVLCKPKSRLLCVLPVSKEKKKASVLGFAFQPSGYNKPTFEILFVSHVPHCEDKTPARPYRTLFASISKNPTPRQGASNSHRRSIILIP